MIENTKLEELAYSIYSINKYAKNYRDSLRYSVGSDFIENQFSMLYLYDLKEQVLDRFQPKEIHKQVTDKKIYKMIPESSDDFRETKGRIIIKLDEKTGLYRRYKRSRKRESKVLYFLYYEIAGYKYHIPIKEEKVKEMNSLHIVNLPSDFYMSGADPDELMDKDKAIEIINNFLSTTPEN